ncbi:hypothetical protein M9Y10_044859 [Tritrichomonas musculus]|uniref:USP domain-containing protein n=1 Tax=Tritrichomonas musculus TaxID=1915356 RepID=A0ABR2JTT8_9EUKA
MNIYYQQDEKGSDHGFFIALNEMEFCLQTILNFPQYLFIKISNNSPQIDHNFIVEEKIVFTKEDKTLIEYEIIAIIFNSSNHFYSLHRGWNIHSGPIWILYNDPEDPISYDGFLKDSIIHFNLMISHAKVFIYKVM